MNTKLKSRKTKSENIFCKNYQDNEYLNILRKPYLAIFLASLTLFVSCSKYDNHLIESNSIDELTLKNIHHNIQIELSNSFFLETTISL